MATEKIRELLDSGWKPENEGSVHMAYLALYSGFNHWKKTQPRIYMMPSKTSFHRMAYSRKSEENEYVRRLGAVQVEATEEAVSNLIVYAAKYVDFSTSKTATSRLGPLLGSAMRYQPLSSTMCSSAMHQKTKSLSFANSQRH